MQYSVVAHSLWGMGSFFWERLIMPNSIVVGGQWGDEGKAKVIDYLTEHSDIIIRYHGGANAGHTVVANGQKFVFHMVPSGIMYPSKTCVIGNGVVFDAEQFLIEIDDLKQRGISVENRLFISDLAHLVFPYHKALDNAREASIKGEKIGTTGRGIGPAYSDKVNRSGIRIGELGNWETFANKVTSQFNEKKNLIEHIYKQPFDLDLNTILDNFKKIRERIIPFIADTSSYIYKNLQEKKNLLFEGAQGTFLDIDHGTYPFVTSSNTISGSACTGAGVGPAVIDHVIGIVKAYTTRVGNGPFPTELFDSMGEKLQAEGHEFGATTGRRRRCGWFDSVLIRKAIQLNGFTRIALTKLDVLSTFDEIKICTHYEIDGIKREQFPSSPEDFKKAVPIYETLSGWNEDISKYRDFSQLPQKAKAFINRISELCYNIPNLIVSVGPDRKETMVVEPL